MIPVTNTIVVVTNIFGATNVDGQSFTRQSITYFTNYTFVADPIVCTNGVPPPEFHQGIGRMTFVRRSFDSLLGQFFVPVTNRFPLNVVTNNQLVAQLFERPVTVPDLLFSADDLVQPPNDPVPLLVPYISRSISYNTNNILPGLPGPGLIEPSQVIIFNKVGPSFRNIGPIYLDEPSNVPFFVWGSFDGSTNEPIIYPSGTSIDLYEQGVLMQVTTATLPGGTAGSSYSAQLQGSGGEPPYSWSLAPGSASLPPGLGVFDPACACWVIPADGAISGTPQSAGTNMFTVRLTDTGNRSVTRDLSIKISGP